MTISSTNAMALLSVTGGTVSLPSGGTVGTADLSAGLGTLSAPASPLTVTSTLKLANSVTATITGGARSRSAGPTWPITRRPARSVFPAAR